MPFSPEPPSDALLERGAELEAIAAALEAARAGEGALVVVEGPAGIGKTRLVRAARDAAGRAGMAVLAARASNLERGFEWGVVRQLLETPVIAQGDDVLKGPAALATSLVSPDADARSDEGALLHGLYWLCANLAERGPVLLTVDDAHWSDLPSLRFVAYLARRVEGLALAVVVAARPGEAPVEQELLTGLAAEPAAAALRPAPLSDTAVSAVLAARLGTQAHAQFTAACREATQGNPFLLEEVARAVREQGLTPDAQAARAVADLGPRSVAQAITRRVRLLAPGAVDVSRAIAVLGPDAELRRVAALAGADPAGAARTADALVAAEVLVGGRPLDFIHPVARAAVYGDLPAGERSRLHATAAAMLADESAPAGRVAAHLLSTEPSGDPHTVRVLRAAAGEAMASGAPPAAIGYLTRALTEPPPAGEVSDVLHELGRAEAVDGRASDFEAHLRRAAELARAPEQRAAAALDLARAFAMAGDLAKTGHTCLDALANLGDGAPALEAALEAELLTVALNDYALDEPAAPRLQRRLAELSDGRLDDPALLAATGLALAVAMPPAQVGGEVAQRAAAADTPAINSLMPGCIANALLFAGQLEDAASYFAALIDEARRRGLKLWTALSTGFRARISLELGEVRRAEEEARLGLELYEDTVAVSGPHFVGYLTAHLAYVLLERTAFDEADALIARCAIPDGTAATYAASLLLGARSRLRLAQQRPQDALADATASAPPILRDGNPATRPWRSEAALALLALGRREEARALADEELALARRFDVPHAVAAALRATARCDDDLQRAKTLLEEAIVVVTPTPARLELARATVELGAVLRRMGKRQAAVETLRSALDLAHRSGATAISERAHAEMLTAGARPRRAVLSGADALTTSERRVADLAAQGHTNQAIAQALFVTTRTVEAHLTRAFRKLDIQSRGQLAAALAGDPMVRGMQQSAHVGGRRSRQPGNAPSRQEE